MALGSSWVSFLKSVDDDEPEKDVLDQSDAFLVKSFSTPAKAYAVRFEALAAHASFPKCLTTQAFLAGVV